MVIKNAVGGWFHLMELNVKLGPNEVVDLDFICSRDEQNASKELRRAISRKFVTVENIQLTPHHHFQASSMVLSSARQYNGPIRKAVFLKVDIPINPTHKLFAMRDADSKLAIVKAATDVTLLGTIVREERDAGVVQAAHQKLQELVEHNL